MNKKTKQFLHRGILILLILATLLTGCRWADHSVTTAAPTDEQIYEGSISTTEDALTTDVAATEEETQNTVGMPDAKPERILCVESPEDKITFLRSLLMGILAIPEQCGDSCYVKITGITEERRNENVIKGVRIRECEVIPSVYYIKDNTLYRRPPYLLDWKEIINDQEELKYLYNPYMIFAWKENIPEDKKLSEDELKEIYEAKCNRLVTISGTLSHELYPLGQAAGIEKPDWDAYLQMAGLWYTKLTGQCYGNIAGDIYVVERDETYTSGSYWICFDGMEPIKIPRMEGGVSFQRVEAPPAVEGADFAKEKDDALFRLSFDLVVEPAEDAE